MSEMFPIKTNKMIMLAPKAIRVPVHNIPENIKASETKLKRDGFFLISCKKNASPITKKLPNCV